MAGAGITAAIGDINIHISIIMPVVSDVRPVLPPAPIPAADSTKVTSVEVPEAAPDTIPIVLAISGHPVSFILPFESIIPTLSATPTRVPIMLNISIKQNVIKSVINDNQPICISPWKLNLNNVNPN